MSHQVLLSLLVYLLLLAVLWHSQWNRFHLGPSHAKGVRRALLPRRLKSRTPLDCPACCEASSPASTQRPLSPVRPWREIKSRRGAPRRVKTEGFACPNRACGYYGIRDADVHALVGDGLYGRAEQIQRLRCQACRTTFSARLHTPLYRLKTPSHRVALVLSALAEGLDLSAAERVFGIRHATITSWLLRAGAHAQTLHERSFCDLMLAHKQVVELRTRLRSHTQVLWLWVAIDPLSKCIPVLQLGPRTHQMAHLLIHRLREQLAPGCLPLFTSDGLNAYFYALTAHFGHWLKQECRKRKACQWHVATGLMYAQVQKSYRRRKLARVKHVIQLGAQPAFTQALQALGFLDESTQPLLSG